MIKQINVTERLAELSLETISDLQRENENYYIEGFYDAKIEAIKQVEVLLKSFEPGTFTYIALNTAILKIKCLEHKKHKP